jgi:hypothetical protein
MPTTISTAPFLFDFANNSIKFILSGTPVNVNGNKAVSRYKINTFPRADYYITISYGNKKFFFAIRTSNTAKTNPYEIFLYSTTLQKKTELISKIAQNYYIEKDYAVTVSDTLEITFTARQNGGEEVILQTNDSVANIQLISHTTGTARVEKEGYKLFAKLEITRFTAGSAVVKTPEILLHVDSANKASLPLTLLRSYFQGVDTPAISQKFAAYSLKYAMIKCRLVFSDYFDGLVQMLKYSNEYYLVNGKISEAHRALNFPDWSCPMGESNKFYNFIRPRSYGSSSGLTVKSYQTMPQYAYFMLFNTNAASNYNTSLQFRVNILNESGSTKNNINPGALTLSNFSIVRVPLSIDALSLQNHSTKILSYTVRVYHSTAPNAVWTRTFVMQEKPYYAQEFLLQNRYGVLESFFVDHEMIEKIVDGEKVTCDDKIEIDVQDIFTTYTARTGFKSDFEMKLLAEAIENKHHYKIVNNTLLPITILPDTLTILDEKEDLQMAEFQYTFKILDKTLAVTASTIRTVDKYDFAAMWQEADYQIWDDRLVYQEETNTTVTLES